MTQDEIIRMAREAGFVIWSDTSRKGMVDWACEYDTELERFAALVAAHVKSDQIQTAYQQGCEDMKRRMENRMQQLEAQLQLCQTAVAHEREACAKVCEIADEYCTGDHAAAIRARGEK